MINASRASNTELHDGDLEGKNKDIEGRGNYLDMYKPTSNETHFISNISEIIHEEEREKTSCIGKPVLIAWVTYIEKLTFPHLFPTGKFSYKF